MKAFLFSCMFLLLNNPALAWDYAKHSIPVDQIISGGPPRDGIPALFSPKYLPAAEAAFMREKEEVLGVVIDGEARAYPLRIMSWHELVNDRVAGIPILASW